MEVFVNHISLYLHVVFNLEIAACRAFLDAYRQVLPLLLEELAIAASAYGWMRAHDLWLYEELYLKGNQRVRAFFRPQERFTPFAERWAMVATSLQ